MAVLVQATTICGISVHRSPKHKQPKQMDDQHGVDPCHGTLCSHKEECSSDTWMTLKNTMLSERQL